MSNVYFYKADITSPKRLPELGRQIREEHGDPTVLINNAGVGYNMNILDKTEDQLRRTFEVNTMAHFLLFKEFAPAMIKRNHGHIVTIASMASFLVHAQNVDYACTRASALAFYEGISQELKHRYNANKVHTTYVVLIFTEPICPTSVMGSRLMSCHIVVLSIRPEFKLL